MLVELRPDAPAVAQRPVLHTVCLVCGGYGGRVLRKLLRPRAGERIVAGSAAIADVAAGFVPGTRRTLSARVVFDGDPADLEAWLGLHDLVLV